ncbi:insulinase family protein [Paraglaciecola sp. L3A3]|uniref:insulinase family protein n=1 Tax=Paraglaciecola sp. L3A3 TaxID=2686358 RepID=UPI00131C07B4|nr:insulinase family protein [Paraglaciecola sp. L3A3]
MGLSISCRLRYVFLFIISLLFIACTTTNYVAEESSKPIPQTSIVKSPNDNRQYDSIILDNQLEIVLVSDPSIEKSAVAISVAVGSFQEPKEFAGLAHYLEHMLFMGTKSYPEVGGYAEFVSLNGGVQNAYTELDHTNYMVAVNNDAFEQLLARFSGFFYEANLDPKYADKERHAVHSEWTMKSPNDWVILEQLNGLTLNPSHPIARFNWGNLASLKDSQTQSLQDALVQFYDTYYSANLMKGTLISALSISEMKTLARQYFSKIPNKNTDRPQIITPVIQPKHLNKIIHYVPQTDMRQLQIKFVIANNNDEFAVKPNGYVEYLLSNEMPGALASVLRDAGFSEAVYSSYDADKYLNAGDLTLYIDLTESGVNHRDEVMGAVWGYLTLLKQKGVDKKYFNEIKQSLNNSFRFKEKSNDYDYAMQIAANLQNVPVEYVLSSDYAYQRFEPSAIYRVLDQLDLSKARVLYIDKDQPVDKDMLFFEGQYSVSEMTPEILENWHQLAANYNLNLPRENKLMPSRFELQPAVLTGKPKQLIAEPGVSLHLAHSALFVEPKGLLFIAMNTGLSKKTARNQVLSNILKRGLMQQLTELQSEAYIAGMGLNLDIINGLSITVSGFTDQQMALIERCLQQVLAFTLTEQELANHIASIKSAIESSKKQILLDQLFPKYRKVLNLDNYSDSKILQEVDSITLEELVRFRDELLITANVNILAFGNYNEQQSKEVANLVLANLPVNRQFSSFYLSPELAVKAGQVFNWQEDINMSDVAMADTYLMPLKLADFAAAQVLNQIIQPALFEQIRTEEQLAYALGFFSQKINEQLLLGYYIQSPVKGLADIYERIKLFRANFVEDLINMPSSKFKQVKNSVLAELQQSAKNLTSEVVSVLEDWRQHNFDFDSKAKLVQELSKLQQEDVINLYRNIEADDTFGRLMLQLRGHNFATEKYVHFENSQSVTDVDKFHQDFAQ